MCAIPLTPPPSRTRSASAPDIRGPPVLGDRRITPSWSLWSLDAQLRALVGGLHPYFPVFFKAAVPDLPPKGGVPKHRGTSPGEAGRRSTGRGTSLLATPIARAGASVADMLVTGAAGIDHVEEWLTNQHGS